MIRRQALLGILDQAVCSGANFLGFLLVSRGQDPGAAGIYATYFALLTMTAGIQNALVTGPMRVIGGGYIDTEREEYFARTTHFQLTLACLITGIFAVGIFIRGNWEWAVTFSVACLAQQFQAYSKAISMTRLDGVAALVSDCITHGLRLSVLYSLSTFGPVSPTDGFLALAVGSFCGAFIHKVFASFQPLHLWATAKQHWFQGKWLLVETASFYLSTHFYLLMVPALIGMKAAGMFAALQNLMNIANVATMGVVAAAPTIIRRHLLNEGRLGWLRASGAFLAITVGVATAIVGLMSMFGRELMMFLYGQTYAEQSELIPLFGFAYVLAGTNAIAGAAFRAADRPDAGAVAKALTAVGTIAFGPILIRVFGLEGAVLGLLATQLVWLMVYAAFLVSGAVSVENIERLRQKMSTKS